MPKGNKEPKDTPKTEKTDKPNTEEADQPKTEVLVVTPAQIDPASPEADKEVMAALYQMATIGKNPTVAMFWIKWRCGVGDSGSKKSRKSDQVPTIIIRSEEKQA